MPEISGVYEWLALSSCGRWRLDVSYTTLAPTLAVLPRSSGRPVMMLIVAPMPPGGVSARELLYTWICEIDSEARLEKSNARPAWSARFDVGIWRPFSSTMFRSGPTPRTVTCAPSPRLRSIDTPEMRCSDSARFVSGNLPISSATMPSTMPSELRFRFSVDCMLARIPLTTTLGASIASPLVCAVVAWVAGPLGPPAASWAWPGAASAAQAPATASVIRR